MQDVLTELEASYFPIAPMGEAVTGKRNATPDIQTARNRPAHFLRNDLTFRDLRCAIQNLGFELELLDGKKSLAKSLC